MSDAIQAYDLGRFQRIVQVDGSRIRGKFQVLSARDDRDEAWVSAIDVTVYADDDRSWGRVFYSNDLTGSVKDGVAQLSKHMVASNKLHDVEDVWDEMLAVLAAAAAAAKFDEQSQDVQP